MLPDLEGFCVLSRDECKADIDEARSWKKVSTTDREAPIGGNTPFVMPNGGHTGRRFGFEQYQDSATTAASTSAPLPPPRPPTSERSRPSTPPSPRNPPPNPSGSAWPPGRPTSPRSTTTWSSTAERSTRPGEGSGRWRTTTRRRRRSTTE